MKRLWAPTLLWGWMLSMGAGSLSATPENTLLETADTLSLTESLTLIPDFHLAPTQWWKWTAPGAGLLTVNWNHADVTFYNDAGERLYSAPSQPVTSFIQPVLGGTTISIHGQGTVPVPIEFTFASPPLNDAFAHADTLHDTARLRIALHGLTLEPGEPHSPPGGSAWWRWTPSRSGLVTIKATSASSLHSASSVFVYRGDNLASLELAPQVGDFSWQVDQGTSYAIALLQEGAMELSIAMERSSPHPSLAESLDLDSARSYQRSLLPPASSSFPTEYWPASWWKWEAPADGLLLIAPGNGLVTNVYALEPGIEPVLIENPEVFQGKQYAIEASNRGSELPETVQFDFAQSVQGNDHVATPFDIPDLVTFIGIASTNTNLLTWKWTPSRDVLVTVRAHPASIVIPYHVDIRRFDTQELITGVEEQQPWLAEAGVTYLFEQHVHEENPQIFRLETYPIYHHHLLAPPIDLGNAPNLRARSSSFPPPPPTGEAEDPLHPWWVWTAPADGLLTFKAAKHSYDIGSTLQIYPLAEPSLAPPRADFSVPRVSVKKGITYAIAPVIYPDNPGASIIELELDLEELEVNDDFAKATDLGSLSTVSVMDANQYLPTREAGEPTHIPDHTSVWGSRWWRWRPLETLQVQFYPETAAVYVGDDLATLTRVDMNGTFQSQPGTQYHIAYTQFGEELNPLQLGLNGQPLPAIPANDAFADRVTVPSAWQISRLVSTGTPSLEEGEPTHSTDPLAGSLWWTWTAPRDMRVVVDEGLGVYQGEALSLLTEVPFLPTHDPLLHPRFHAESGSTYHIATRQHLYMAAIPAADVQHDDFAQAKDLGNVSALDLPQSPVGATLEPGELGLYPGDSTGGTLWYTWTPPYDAQAILRVQTNSSGDAWTVGVFTGTEITHLQEIVTPRRRSPVTYTALAGESYRIGVRSDADFTLILTTTRLNPEPVSPVDQPEADPDRDGQTNLIEYAFGTNPNAANLPAFRLEGKRLHLPRQPLNGVALHYQVGEDLVTWEDLVTETVHESQASFFFSPRDHPQRYIRVGVSIR